MRANLSIDDGLLAEATKDTGIQEIPLVRMALEALIQRQAGKRLIATGGTDPSSEAGPRRRLE